jgi:SAM-dependent methyltransferase
MSHVSRKYQQFAYFDQQLGHPDWRGRNVLDFGGNCGNILQGSECTIAHDRYWSVDVSPDGIAEGKRAFPRANWIWWDRYNVNFHPAGVRGAPLPAFAEKFDFIVSYSVFTHLDAVEAEEFTGQLLALLAPGGAFAFTFIDPHFHSWPEDYPGTNLMWRLERMSQRVRNEAAAMQERVRDWDCFTLIGDGDIYRGDDPLADPERYRGEEYHVFHTAELMARRFPTAEIRPPANYEMQHCCILRASRR